MINIQDLKTLAEACGDGFYCDEPYREDRKYSRTEVTSLEFSAAATPAVVLKLIAELETARNQPVERAMVLSCANCSFTLPNSDGERGAPAGDTLKEAALILESIDRRKTDRAARLGLLAGTYALIDEDTLNDLSSSACQTALCEGINEEAFARLARTVEQKCRVNVARLWQG